MEHERDIEFFCQFDLAIERLALRRPRVGIAAVVVEPALAYGNDLRMCRESLIEIVVECFATRRKFFGLGTELLRVVIRLARVDRMEPDGGVHPFGKLFGNLHRPRAGVALGTDVRVPRAGLQRAFDRLSPVAVECGDIQVRVDVEIVGHSYSFLKNSGSGGVFASSACVIFCAVPGSMGRSRTAISRSDRRRCTISCSASSRFSLIFLNGWRSWIKRSEEPIISQIWSAARLT